MRKITLKNKRVRILIAVIIMISQLIMPAQSVGAASKYITADMFIKQLVEALKLNINTSSGQPYIDAAMTANILTTEDFTNYTSYITRTDAAVLLNRADEYLHGDNVDTELLKIVLAKRISDISSIEDSKREAVAKCFAKGIINGYGNGYYIQNRSFKGSEYITKSTAASWISLILNPAKRAKLSPDGELIRTTNLPKNADKYDYILDCYPNAFYEKKFEFMLNNLYTEKKRNKDYNIYPVEMKNATFTNWYKSWPFSVEINKYLDDWTELAEKYLHYVFNVNYKTVDDNWINGLASLYVKSNVDEADAIRTYYIPKMKENHVIVESSVIAVEPSTLYKDTEYCIRAYVRYRITAKDITVKQNKLIYTQYPELDNLKNGKWRTGIFDIRIGTNNGFSGDGADFVIDPLTNFVDEFNVPID